MHFPFYLLISGVNCILPKQCIFAEALDIQYEFLYLAKARVNPIRYFARVLAAFALIACCQDYGKKENCF